MPKQKLHYRPADTSVVILAAGHGKRMLPLTAKTPKPLLKIGKYSLIEHHLRKLSALGFRNIIINTAYLGEMIQQKIGSGSQFNLNIRYSDESKTGALETAGGLRQALAMINSDPFLVINSDIWTDFDFTSLLLPLTESGRLVLVNNPSHNQTGDFSLNNSHISKRNDSGLDNFTFSGIALYKKSIFTNLPTGKQALAPVLHKLVDKKQLSGLVYSGVWTDVGTPDRLEKLNFNIQE